MLGQPATAVAGDHPGVGDAGAAQVELGGPREVVPALDGPHVARQSCQQRGLESEAGSYLEDRLIATQPQRFEHARDQRRLSGDLPVWDRHRFVQLSAVPQPGRDEGRARHCFERGEDARVPDAGAHDCRQQIAGLRGPAHAARR